MKYNFMRFPGGKAKAFTMSYDDGFKFDIKLSDIIGEYGLKCTFNFARSFHDEDFLTAEEVKKYMLDRGHEVAAHGFNHRAEGSMRPIEAITDILESRRSLEREYGIIVRGFAYPDTGIRNFKRDFSYEDVKNYLKELEIAYARTAGGDNDSFDMPVDWHAWMPTAHHDNCEIFKFIDEFVSMDIDSIYPSRRQPRLFYMWGHSHEFESKNRWEHLREICDKISGKDDIWYATNIEIYDYAKAYFSLIYNADSTMVYNPSLITVWFDVDGVLYSINPGETINIKD